MPNYHISIRSLSPFPDLVAGLCFYSAWAKPSQYMDSPEDCVRAFAYVSYSQTKAFEVMTTRLSQGDTSLLAEVHATTSGLKVLISTSTIQDLEVARRSMGGHGYSAFAGLGRIYADYLPSATYVGSITAIAISDPLLDLKATILCWTNK